MTQKTFSFWLCTLLSGVIIGIASQRIPEARTHCESVKPHSYSLYCNDNGLLSNHPITKSGYLAYDGYNNSSWVYEHFTKDSIQNNDRFNLSLQGR